MTHWIQPTEALAGQLDVPPVPLPVSSSTSEAMEAGHIELPALARDVDTYLAEADADDPKTPVLRRCAASLALTAANQCLEADDHSAAADLLRLAARHAPDDTGIRAAYGSALWMSGRRFDGLAQLTRAVSLNSEQGRVVPMLWILTARAMADAGRHGDALLLLEELAATGPSDFRFWELIDSIDGRSTPVDGGYRPADAEEVLTRIAESISAAAATPADAMSVVGTLGQADEEPTAAPPLCLEIAASQYSQGVGTARPGTLGLLQATVGVVRSGDSRPAPTAARSTVELSLESDGDLASALVAVDDSQESVAAASLLEAAARCLAAFPADSEQQHDQFDHDLDPGSSAALAALLDVITSASEFGVPATGLPISAVVEYAADLDGGGLRGRVGALLDTELSPSDIREGLAELARRGFVRLDQTTAHPEAYLEFLTKGFGLAMGWNRFTHHDTHARSLSRRQFVTAGPGILRLGPTGGGGVSWSVRQRSEVQHELGVELAIIS